MHLEQRITTNFLHYRSNYATIAVVVVACSILMSPGLLVSLFLSLGLCLYFIPASDRVVMLGDRELNRNERITVAVAGSFVLLSVTGNFYRLLRIILTAAGICGLHMVFRPRNIRSKANRFYEEAKMNYSNQKQDEDEYKAELRRRRK
ncbi:unnamed protein product [Heterosigma akashiwo]